MAASTGRARASAAASPPTMIDRAPPRSTLSHPHRARRPRRRRAPPRAASARAAAGDGARVDDSAGRGDLEDAAAPPPDDLDVARPAARSARHRPPRAGGRALAAAAPSATRRRPARALRLPPSPACRRRRFRAIGAPMIPSRRTEPHGGSMPRTAQGRRQRARRSTVACWMVTPRRSLCHRPGQANGTLRLERPSLRSSPSPATPSRAPRD